MGTKDAVAVVGRGVDEEVKSGMEKVGGSFGSGGV